MLRIARFVPGVPCWLCRNLEYCDAQRSMRSIDPTSDGVQRAAKTSVARLTLPPFGAALVA